MRGEDLACFEFEDEVRAATWTASDHAPFMRKGVACFGVWGSMGDGVKFYHSAGDTFDAVDLRRTNNAAMAMAFIVSRLADLDERPTVRITEDEAKTRLGEIVSRSWIAISRIISRRRFPQRLRRFFFGRAAFAGGAPGGS
jgi:Zn-dependent M28 family amino/carboxypeptidase